MSLKLYERDMELDAVETVNTGSAIPEIQLWTETQTQHLQ